VDRAVAVHQVGLGVVQLAGDAVEALVGVELDVAVVVDPLEKRLHRDVVPGLGGPDEVGVGDFQELPGLPEALARLIDPRLGGHPPGLGGALHLEPVFIGPGQEHDVVTPEAAPPGDHVGDNRRVRRPDVGYVVDVVDRRRQEEGAGHRPQDTDLIVLLGPNS
jgi:hypothetical protein